MFAKGSRLKKHKTAILFFSLKQAAWIVSWETVPNTVYMYMNNVDGSVVGSLGRAIKIELTDTAVPVHHQNVPITLTIEDNKYDLVRGGLVKFNNT